MPVSVLDLFTIGIGPSSSHAVGPMRAARRFVETLHCDGVLQQVHRIVVTLYGSLALTGRGHGTDRAIMLGLAGNRPDAVDPDEVPRFVEQVQTSLELTIFGQVPIRFDPDRDLVFDRRETLVQHPNALRLAAFAADGKLLKEEVYFSIGGGFVVRDDEFGREATGEASLPFPFRTGNEMLEMAAESGLSVSGMMWQNELTRHNESTLRTELLKRWEVMRQCAERGCRNEGILPGGLKVRRRAPELFRKLRANSSGHHLDPLSALDWIDVIALAVSEENAAAGRIVTAPTNGAAGIMPAVMHYYHRYHDGDEECVIRFFLVAAAIAILFKENASLSGAEVGCQGEVGVACSMSAAALTEVLGGSVMQVEQAAEIGMEHNLGLTCDPVGGLVQVPCIERNAMGAVKAINASRLALRGTGEHRISLDRVIDTMRRTGADMSTNYKETSRGGLAVNLAEC